MTKREKEKLAELMRAMRQAARDEFCWSVIQPTFNQIVNDFDLPSTAYHLTRGEAN